MKTIKIFTQDSYQKECEAIVLDLKKDEEGRQIIVLDQTVFYAMSGGQPGDIGIITGPSGEEQVIDTRYASNDKVLIYHYLAEDTKLQVGDKVHCQIDWDRRYRLMKLHSLTHIAGLLFEKKYGKHEIFGSNMSDKGRIDYKYFDPIDFEWLNQETQRVIDEAHDINTRGEEGNEVRRIWEMEDLEPMPCGGTHVKNSSEIGKIRLKRKGLGSQGQRIYCMLENS
jgi:alanyl-tRNA synthetase